MDANRHSSAVGGGGASSDAGACLMESELGASDALDVSVDSGKMVGSKTTCKAARGSAICLSLLKAPKSNPTVSSAWAASETLRAVVGDF